jgi:acetylornithine deacetylase/succinyl-diaminopimelate desuccinylase-like protein
MTGGSPIDRVSRDEILGLASRLISIPSTSGEERAVMEEVARWCTSVGLPFEVIASDHDRPNLVISLRDATAGPTIVMNGTSTRFPSQIFLRGDPVRTTRP